MSKRPKYPGIRVVANGNHLVAYLTEARIADAGVFYPITPSTEMGELYQQSFAEGRLTVFGGRTLAAEAEGEHAAQGGAIAHSVTGKRVVNFTSGQGIVYGIEQYYHAPGKLSTMIVEVAARALTKHALNVHCSHDDFYAALDTGWIMLMARDAQQAADQALIIRKVAELSLNPGMNIQDGFLTSHLERTFYELEADLIREFLGAPDDIIDCPTKAQRELFGPTRRRVPEMIDLRNPALLGPVQNQEHYMNGVIARRNNFNEPILGFLEEAYREFGELTSRHYGMITEYACEDAETVFLSLGSAAENIEAAVDHLRRTRGAKVGSIHLNVLRPFPEAEIVRALRGKKQAIILERTDEALAPGNPIIRDIRSAMARAHERKDLGYQGELPCIRCDEIPRMFGATYGLGSRDFRPEGIIGAYEFVTGAIKRQDDASAADGTDYFTLGIDHPYAVVSEETPSLLPDHAIAVRLHSIGGWGMITTGKNLGAIIGELGDDISRRSGETDDWGRPKELVHVSANPKYGSEKKGAPTAYFLTVAPERVRVNCDLRHVDVVLCCDPKAFTHSNPLDGLTDGGAFVWESDESPEAAWSRIPLSLRQQIIDHDIRLFTLPGFEIARNATARPDLQLRMQGNAFLGAFFKVSTFLEDNRVDNDHFLTVVREQYEKKFGRFGEAVVESNMQVMRDGFSRVTEVPAGTVDAADHSSMRGETLLPVVADGKPDPNEGIPDDRYPLHRIEYFDREFRAGLGYDQPASALASVGVMAAATGATASKYVARRETPVFIAENCTQCMACISACPDTALPNTAQDIRTVLATSIDHYVSSQEDREALIGALDEIEEAARAVMVAAVKAKEKTPFSHIIKRLLDERDIASDESKSELIQVLDLVPVAYNKVNAMFGTREKRAPGTGGVFQIYVSDLCKGCGECVTECGDHGALEMVPDSEDLNARVAGAAAFLELLPETERKYLGAYDPDDPCGSKPAVLRNHLIDRTTYNALVSGDGACAGCGEKSVLRAVATLTEAYMRPIYHTKAQRLDEKASALRERGAATLASLHESDPESYARFKMAVAHLLMGLGGENDEDTAGRIAAHGDIDDETTVHAIVAVLEQDAHNHRDIRVVRGLEKNGMAVMAMGAHTGCNTVYGSTPPNNPHPYPWMNSLFQDGATISWLIGESFIHSHARRSVIPERLADVLIEAGGVTPEDYFLLTHLGDEHMTDREIHELPKVWCIGGDGGMGDIGYQNVSKVVLQNRPNVMLMLLDTQVYSNTGGQNSDSSPMPGGFDMNQLGAATQGKLTEKKSVSETLLSGHGSCFVAQVSMADQPRFYKAILDGLAYRGSGFYQAFTSCQPEHGIGDDMATVQAVRIRDSRGMPEFVFDPSRGETYPEALDVSANPNENRDWATARLGKQRYIYTVAHWAHTEARFRRHFKRVSREQADQMIHLEDKLVGITQRDVVDRRFADPEHRAYVPDFEVYADFEGPSGDFVPVAVSRQMVLFCVERRKAWRLLQSKAGIENKDYIAQRTLLARVDAGEIDGKELDRRGRELLEELLSAA